MNYQLLTGILIIIIIILLFTPHQKERFNSNNLDLPWSNTIVNTDFVKPLKTNNISISVNSKKGDRIIMVTSINGINIGDTISINPGSNNSETKTVLGTGNSLLYLDSNLEYTHLPNEPIHNNSNPNENNVENNNTPVKKYAEINDQGLLQFEPSEIRKFIPYNSSGYCSNSNVCSGPGGCRGKDQNPGNGGCNHYCPGGGFYRSDLNGCVSDYCIKPTLKSCMSEWFYKNCPSQTCKDLVKNISNDLVLPRAINIPNKNFSNPKLKSNSYTYVNGMYDNWYMNGPIINNSSAWGYPIPYPNGNQAFSLQQRSYVQINLHLIEGKYRISLWACGRKCCKGPYPPFNPIKVKISTGSSNNNLQILTFNGKDHISPTSEWQKYTSIFVISKSDVYLLSFGGQTSGVDKSTAIQGIEITQINDKYNIPQVQKVIYEKKYENKQEVDYYTKSSTGAQCYWDSNRNDCAVCQNGGCQCPASDKGQCVKCGYGEACDPNYIQPGKGDCPGGDIGPARFPRSLNECRNICNNIKECKGISYKQSGGICYPKNNICTNNDSNNGFIKYNKI